MLFNEDDMHLVAQGRVSRESTKMANVLGAFGLLVMLAGILLTFGCLWALSILVLGAGTFFLSCYWNLKVGEKYEAEVEKEAQRLYAEYLDSMVMGI